MEISLDGSYHLHGCLIAWLDISDLVLVIAIADEGTFVDLQSSHYHRDQLLPEQLHRSCR
jgi:hypothetical protein